MSTLTCDAFLGGRLRIWQAARGYRGATDPVLLAAACPAKAGQTVLDLGCGTGIAALCLGARVPGLVLTGLELLETHADLARRNAAENATPLEVIQGDIRAMPAGLRARQFDHVICNPPYFPPGTPGQNADRNTALQAEVPLEVWAAQALRRAGPKGSVTFIARTDALPPLVATLGKRAGALCLLPIAARVGQEAGRIILQVQKGRRTPARIMPPLILHQGASHTKDGEDFTPEARALLRAAEHLPL